MHDRPGNVDKELGERTGGSGTSVLVRKLEEPVPQASTVPGDVPPRVRSLPPRCQFRKVRPVILADVVVAHIGGVHDEGQPPGAVDRTESGRNSGSYRAFQQVELCRAQAVLQREDRAGGVELVALFVESAEMDIESLVEVLQDFDRALVSNARHAPLTSSPCRR